MKKLSVLIILLLLVMSGCSKDEPTQTEQLENLPTVTITMENGDEMVAELYPHIAPNTVNNFIDLAQNGYYDGLIFHRVIPGFMIQGGDPEGTGMGGPGYSIKGEFKSNGFENDLKHSRGVLSMARSSLPDSAGSQFFIMAKDSTHLDGDYASFGKVIENIEAVDTIINVERDANDRPLEDVRIKTIEVQLNDYNFTKPETIKN